MEEKSQKGHIVGARTPQKCSCVKDAREKPKDAGGTTI